LGYDGAVGFIMKTQAPSPAKINSRVQSAEVLYLRKVLCKKLRKDR